MCLFNNCKFLKILTAYVVWALCYAIKLLIIIYRSIFGNINEQTMHNFAICWYYEWTICYELSKSITLGNIVACGCYACTNVVISFYKVLKDRLIRSVQSHENEKCWFSWACCLQVVFLSLIYCVWLVIDHQLECICYWLIWNSKKKDSCVVCSNNSCSSYSAIHVFFYPYWFLKMAICEMADMLFMMLRNYHY
jgi:hypothetical protein